MSDTTGTETVDRSPTETLIRDLYATIAFFTANPTLPVPWAVTLNARVDTLQEVEAIAERFGRREYGSHDIDGTPQTDFDIPGVDGRINVIVSAPKPKRFQ
jgi:hypothetical protein